MELAQILTQYPAATLVFVAWPLLFVWLLVSTQTQSAKREERLIVVNEQWQKVLADLTAKIDRLTDRLEGR